MGGRGPGADGGGIGRLVEVGGTLLLSSQDYLYDHGLTSFGVNHLGVTDYDDKGQRRRRRVLPFEAVRTTLSYPSAIIPMCGAVVGRLRGVHPATAGSRALVDQGTDGVFAFWIEAMAEPGTGEPVQAAINWVLKPPVCPADITGDGFVSVEDLLVVLSTGAGADPRTSTRMGPSMSWTSGVVAARGECD